MLHEPRRLLQLDPSIRPWLKKPVAAFAFAESCGTTKKIRLSFMVQKS